MPATKNASLMRGLAALAGAALLLLLAISRLVQAGPAAPSVLNDAENVGCLPHGGLLDKVRVIWDDTNDGNTDYNVYRKNVTSNSWGDPLATVTDPDGNGQWKYVDENASLTTVYHYRVTAVDDDEESSAASALICREPLSLALDIDNDPNTDPNFRMYYRLVECPTFDGKAACTANDLLNGQNQHVVEALQTSEAYRSEIIGYNMNDPAIWNGGKPFPLDFFPCNNGCANGDGITYRPDWFDDNQDYNPATGAGDDYEYFVVGHEIFHKTQSSHGGSSPDPFGKWISEGQARATEDKLCIFNALQCIIWDNVAVKYYLGQVNGYLGNPQKGLLEGSYNAALFWVYMMEQFGTIQTASDYGMDVMTSYWQQHEDNIANNVAKDGIGTINDMLDQTYQSSRRFKDIFQDFAVANYAKDLISDPAPAGFANYNYLDEEDCVACAYDPVKRTVSQTLSLGQPIFGTVSVDGWGIRYFEIDPDPSVSVINMEVETLQATPNALYYHVLAIDNGQIVEQWTDEGTSFNLSVSNINPVYDRLVLIVAAYDNATNFKYGFNLTDGLYILSPNAQFPALAGETTSPKKFIAQVEVIDEDLQPIAGIDPEDFTITVGSQVINPPANAGDNAIVAYTYIAGQYWLVLRAPDAPGCTICELKIEYGEYEDIEVDAVLYGPQPSVDNMIIIDRSGSMAGPKIVAAQEAAKVYVDSYDTGDRLGVLSYNVAPTTEFALTGWTNTSRLDAQDAIDTMAAPNNDTATGAALREGMAQLDAQGSPNPAWTMVLLSDGKDTVDDTKDHIPEFLKEYKARVDDNKQVPIIHVVAVGDDADGVALEQVTAASGGLFQFVPEASVQGRTATTTAEMLPLELAEIYRVFAETVLAEQQILARQLDLTDPNVATTDITVEAGASQAIFVLKMTPNTATAPSFDLRDPGNVSVAPTLVSEGQYLWRIPAPEAGVWKLTVRACTAVVCGRLFLVEASLVSDLTLQGFLGLPPEERLAGKAMPILISLSDIAPLTGAMIQGTVERTGESLTFYDDGNHGDGAANDGFYGGTVYDTFDAGGYTVVVDAAGVSPLAGPYVRRARLSFFMAGGKDSDGDRLPDWWEVGCTDPALDDSALDTDKDDLVNAQEYFRHTDACDPDTDDGGEADGSEVNRDADPLWPEDDNGLPPRLKAWPAPGRVILRLSPPNELTGPPPPLAVYRGSSVDGPFSLFVRNVTSMELVDENLTNGKLYCYYAIAEGRETSAPSAISCATPKADPYPPHGDVVLPPDVIEPVPPRTRVLLEAYDDPAMEENPVFDGALLFAAAESGLAEMQLSNNSDFEGAVWQPYQAATEWTFAPRADGRATLFVRFRDKAGNISEISALAVMVDPDATQMSFTLMPIVLGNP